MADDRMVEDPGMVELCEPNGPTINFLLHLGAAVFCLLLLVGGVSSISAKPELGPRIGGYCLLAFVAFIPGGYACTGFDKRVVLDSRGITMFDTLFYWSEERETLLPWDRIHKIYVYDKPPKNPRLFKQYGIREKAIIKRESGKLRDVSFEWCAFNGDWKKAVEIIRKNLPDYCIGSEEEYTLRYLSNRRARD